MILILMALQPSFKDTYGLLLDRFPAKAEQDDTTFLFQLPLNKGPFCSLFSATRLPHTEVTYMSPLNSQIYGISFPPILDAISASFQHSTRVG